MVSQTEMENELQHRVGLDDEADSRKTVIKIKGKRGDNIYIAEFGYGSISVDGAELFDNYPEFDEEIYKHKEEWVTRSAEEMVSVLKKYFL